MNLVIDIGNTRIKAGIFDGPKITDRISDSEEGKNIPDWITEKKANVSDCLISSMAGIPKKLIYKLKHSGITPVELNAKTPVPFRNNYSTITTLGRDRIAAVAGACALYPSRNVLIIDAGTAITFDMKTDKEEYLGGNISPGLTMRFRALHEFTAHLPRVDYSDDSDLLGNSTETAIRNGIQNGLIFEINGYLDTLRNKYNELVVILSGGDAHFFDNKLKNPIFVVSDLTLIGLNFILQYNAEKI